VAVSDQFCQIGHETSLQADLYFDQGDVDLVHTGQMAYLKFDAWPGNSYAAAIDAVSAREVQAAPASLSRQNGGELATRTSKAGIAEPLTTAYSARVPLITSPRQLKIGMRGQAKIETDSLTLGARLWRKLWQTFRFAL
jgi:hypothetical protein